MQQYLYNKYNRVLHIMHFSAFIRWLLLQRAATNSYSFNYWIVILQIRNALGLGKEHNWQGRGPVVKTEPLMRWLQSHMMSHSWGGWYTHTGCWIRPTLSEKCRLLLGSKKAMFVFVGDHYWYTQLLPELGKSGYMAISQAEGVQLSSLPWDVRH